MTLALKTCGTIDEATAALALPGTRYMAGGTLAVRAANEGDLSFSTLVRSLDPSLSAIAIDGDAVTLGAAVTMAAIARHPALAALTPAARAIGGPAVRNMATVGGNLFAPAPYGDFAVALLALGAQIRRGNATMSIDQFLATREQAGGLVTHVSFRLPQGNGFRFLKVSRVKPKGISVLSIAARLEIEDGRVKAARIALGCMADRPMRAAAAEQALIGRPITVAGIAPALAVAVEGTAAITDPVASAWYRTEVLPVHLGRLLAG